MRSTPNIGLTVWDNASDEFSPAQLAANWDSIDASVGTAGKAARIQKLSADMSLSALPTLTNSASDIGKLIYIDVAVTGYNTHSIVRWDGTAWRTIGPFPTFASLPTVGNFQGRMIVLTSASGGFNANDVVVNTDGANSWAKVNGGIRSGTTLPVSPSAGDVFLLTAAASGFDAYTLVTYNGAAWTRPGTRGTEVVSSLPGSPYSGQVVVLNTAASGFQAWDTVKWNGSAWQQTSHPILMTTTTFNTLTSIPDGYEVYLQVDSTSGSNWHLRYNSGSASAYKWEYLGGTPLSSEVISANSSSSATYAALSAAGPTITIPRPGDYRVTIGATVTIPNTDGNMTVYMSYDIGAVAAADADAVRVIGGQQDAGASIEKSKIKTGLTQVALTAKYKRVYIDATTGNPTIQDRWMTLTPVRIS